MSFSDFVFHSFFILIFSYFSVSHFSSSRLRSFYSRSSLLLSLTFFSFLQSHPKATKYRYKTLPLYEKLYQLFEGTVATGEYAFTYDDPVVRSQEEGSNEDEWCLHSSPIPSPEPSPASELSRYECTIRTTISSVDIFGLILYL